MVSTGGSISTCPMPRRMFCPGPPVDPEHLALRASAGKAEVRLRAGVVVHERGGAGGLDQVHRAAIAERDILYRSGFDQLSERRGSRLGERRLARHRDTVGELAEREPDVD